MGPFVGCGGGGEKGRELFVEGGLDFVGQEGGEPCFGQRLGFRVFFVWQELGKKGGKGGRW